MKRVLILSLSCIAIMFMVIVSCKKSNNSGNHSYTFTGCRIMQMNDSSTPLGINTHTTLIYNDDGTTGEINTTGTASLTRGLEYFGNMSVLHTAGNYVEIDSIVVVNGLISTLTAHYFTSPASNKISVFTYDAAGEVTSRTDNYSNGTTNTYNFTWQNGDLLSEVSTADSFIYTYDTSLASQDGDWMREYQMITLGYGAVYIKTKHCVASRRHNMNAAQYYFYQKDGNNRIITCNAYTGSSPEQYNYSYFCNP